MSQPWNLGVNYIYLVHKDDNFSFFPPQRTDKFNVKSTGFVHIFNIPYYYS
jgi:hypothetical protein